MASALAVFERQGHPVDLVEQIAYRRDWTFERANDDEISLSVAGSGCDYHVTLTWRPELETLHLAVGCDVKPPRGRLYEVGRLIAMINEQLWLGHFDFWTTEGLLLFRHALLLHGAEPTPTQCEALLEAGMSACERHYQAFQFVIWAGKTAEDALAATLFETEGHA